MALARRTAEIATAATLGLFAGAVIAGALQLDTGWAPTGPQAGYVPLRLGVLLLLVSLLLLLQAARPHDGEAFATREQLQRSLSLMLPTVCMAVTMAFVGTYVAAAGFLAWMARRHGGLGWPRVAALAVGAPVILFLIFELWFGVPLAKGPLEQAFGF